MASKDKLRRFRENETFSCLVQPTTESVLFCDHPLKGRWREDFFHNDLPIVLELGCGKGEYTIALAKRNPNCNYIGVDLKGARLWKGAKEAETSGMPNVGFLRTRIEFITSLFAPGEVAGLWITFADPQLRREKKRLTSPLFLERYRSFLAPGGWINLKTDSRFLHEYSLSLARANELPVRIACNDIYNPKNKELIASFEEGEMLTAVQTFYEKQYLSRGVAITFLSFSLGDSLQIHSPNEDPDEKDRLTAIEDAEVAAKESF